jgi:N-hydroxyarylamine O-acetyltransferase
MPDHLPALDAYFARTGYTGLRSPTLATLNGIIAAHAQTIPFENLDVLLGRGINLEPAAVEQKLVHQKRGGYCFEQNSLLLHVLQALGFTVKPISARVRLQRPRDFTPPRTHLFLRVEIDGESWLADVGIGSLSLTSALRLHSAAEQPTLHEPHRIVREGALLFHQARLGDEWTDVCEFTLEEMPPIDRELANWFTSTHPQSHFRTRLVAARAGPDRRRFAVLNNEFTIRQTSDGSAVKREIKSPDELLAILAEHFDLHFPSGTRFGPPGSPWPA